MHLNSVWYSDSKEMHQAVRNGDLEKLKIIIEKNPTLIAATNWDDNGTPLHKASMQKGNEHIVEYLISKGAMEPPETERALLACVFCIKCLSFCHHYNMEP